MTLFSAPNYCGEFDNAGAMMSVDETLMCSFQVRTMSKRPPGVPDETFTPTCTNRNNETFFFLTFCWSSLSQFSRFSNPQTRSCSMAAERVWAPDAQSLPQGKPRNDTCSLPSTSDPSLLPSLPLLSFLSPNSQKSNLYPGLFPFLSVLLKTFNVTNCLSERVRACVRR